MKSQLYDSGVKVNALLGVTNCKKGSFVNEKKKRLFIPITAEGLFLPHSSSGSGKDQWLKVYEKPDTQNEPLSCI